MPRIPLILRASLFCAAVVATFDVGAALTAQASPSGTTLAILALWDFFSVGLLGLSAQTWIPRTEAVTLRLPTWSRNLVVGLPLILFGWWVPLNWIIEHYRALGPTGWLLVAVFMVLVAVSCALLAQALRHWKSRPRPRNQNLIVALLGAALFSAGYFLDGHLLVGLYDEFHLGLAAFSALALCIGCYMAITSAPSRLLYPKSIDLLLLSSTGVLAAGLSFVTSAESAPRQALSFAKLTYIADAFVADDLADGPAEQREEIAANGYNVTLCEGCNVLLLTIDALRADHVSSYGYKRKTTPHLDELAKKSIRFSHAFTQATKTFDSLPSIYSGVYPSQLDRNYDHEKLRNAKSYLFFVDQGTTLLSERFKQKGYTTAAFFGFHFEQFGYHRGFDTVREDRKDISRPLLKYLKSAKEPFFLASHIDFPHDPYVLHSGFDFGKKPIDRYDSEIAYADSKLGKIVRVLEQRHLLEKTLIIVSADHGEEFGEHGGEYHSRKLHSELLHVPLVVYHPQLSPAVVDEYVELVDVAPFLVEALKMDANSGEFAGQSLFAAISGQRDPVLEGAYSENCQKKGLAAASIATAKWRASAGKAVGGFQLFDREKDPTEQVDVSSQNPEIKETFRKRIQTRAR